MRLRDGLLGLCVLLLCSGAVVIGCQTHGHFYASHPQVFTRERLVEERIGEVGWLKAELAKTDQIETGRFQGYRDLSRFVGVYQKTRAAFDPSLGGRSGIAQDILESRGRTDLLRSRQDELVARQALDNAQRAYDGSQGVTAAAAPTAGDPVVAAPTLPPDPGSPLQSTLPTTAKPRETMAKPGILDDFHDKLLYRDTVNAAIRQTALDDSHDFGGMSLHELTMSVTVVPGSDSRAFGQVNLWLKTVETQDEADERGRSLAFLFDSWLVSLRAAMVRDIYKLHARLAGADPCARETSMCGRSVPDQKFVAWLRGGGLRSTVAVAEELVKTKADDREPLSSIVQTSETRKGIVGDADDFKMISAAVWAQYQVGLSGIVTITPPKFGVSLGASGIPEILRSSLEVEEFIAKELPWVNRKEIEPRCNVIAEGHREPYRKAGWCSFVRRLFRIEQSIHALTVDPKEHAQNVSEVAARRDVVNVIAALQAMLPVEGVSVESTSQYMRESQELLNAITRRPLLMGFGMGSSHFGWVLGPRFGIDDDKAVWRHTPVRHDVSASIVIPGWWTHADIVGEGWWLDRNGKRKKRECLWSQEPALDKEIGPHGERLACGKITIQVRPALDIGRGITQALQKSKLAPPIPGGAAYSSRPGPIIERPKMGGSRVPLRAGEKQTLLVLGKHLWRAPQVFVDSQPADQVRVTSDMRGLIATFDSLVYIGDAGPAAQPILADLTVVTSFGSDFRKEVVKILPPRKATKTSSADAGTAKLLTTFLDASQTRLRFAYKQPQGYSKLQLVSGPSDSAQQTASANPEIWDASRTHVEFDHARPANNTPPDIYRADLVLYPQPNTDAGKRSVLRSGATALFARFKDLAERSATYTRDTAVRFDAHGITAGKLEATIAQGLQPAFVVAYPALEGAIEAKRAHFVLKEPNGSVRAVVKASFGGSSFLADAGALSNAYASIRGSADATLVLTPVLRVGEGTSAIEIPLRPETGATPVTITFTFTGVGQPAAALPDATLKIQADGNADTDLLINVAAADKVLLEKQIPGFERAATRGSMAVLLRPKGGTSPSIRIEGVRASYDSVSKQYVAKVPAGSFRPYATDLRGMIGALDVYLVVAGKTIKTSSDLTLSADSLPPPPNPPTPTFKPETLTFSEGKVGEVLDVEVADGDVDDLKTLGVKERLPSCRVVLRPADATSNMTLVPTHPSGDRILFRLEREVIDAFASRLLAAGSVKVRLVCDGNAGPVEMDATEDLLVEGTDSGG